MVKLLMNWVAGVIVRVLIILLPSILVFYVLSTPVIKLNRAISTFQLPENERVHDLLPKTRWMHLLSCSQFFSEIEEFKSAKSCVNAIWNDPMIEASYMPRCYVVTASSPDVYSSKTETFNFVPVAGPAGISAVVGVYQPETRTIFLVENTDLGDIYNHEVQHFFLHKKFPETLGSGHDQDIWKQCAPQYYRSINMSKSKRMTRKK